MLTFKRFWFQNLPPVLTLLGETDVGHSSGILSDKLQIGKFLNFMDSSWKSACLCYHRLTKPRNLVNIHISIFFQPWGLHRTGLTSFSPSYFTTRFFTEQFIRSLIKTFWPGSMTIGCYNMIWVIRGQLSHQMLVFRFLWAKNVSKTVTDINVCRFASAFNSVMCIISFSAYFQFL